MSDALDSFGEAPVKVKNNIKNIIQKNDIRYIEESNLVYIGDAIIDGQYLFCINGERESSFSQIIKTVVRYKNNQYDNFRMNEEAYNKLVFIKETISIPKILETIPKKNKNFFGISKHFWILYIILILGFLSKSFGNEEPDDYSSTGEEITREAKVFERPGYVTQSEMRWKSPKYETPKKEEFPFSFIYDVNNNRCGTLDEFSERFTYNEIRNPKVVAEFPQRPGEMVFINLKDEMFVFTDTLDRCISYQTYFLEELNKQITEDELKFSSKKFDLED